MPREPNMNYLKDDRPANKNKARLIVWLAGVFGLSLIIIFFLFPDKADVAEEAIALPSFEKIKDIDERKAAFFDFLLPFVEQSNKQTLSLRKEVKRLQDIFAESTELSKKSADRLRELQVEYKLPASKKIAARTFSDLLSRIDIIPPSLALAQAALESAWGTSRFAKEGNNLYGIWCYERGCGMVPKKRPKGESYEVRSFESPKQCFDYYIHNLNTNPHYGSMRAIRRALRRKDAALVGVDLVEGLERYSIESFTYIEKVQRVIESNDLERYD